MSSSLTTLGVIALLATSSAFTVNNNIRLSTTTIKRNVIKTDLQMVYFYHNYSILFINNSYFNVILY